MNINIFFEKLSKCCKIPRFDKGFSLGPFIGSFFVSLVVLSLLSFSMLWLGDKINRKNLAITRYMATSQAPLTGKFYDNIGQKKITVLTYDQQFLRETGSAWPITYGQHADWILRIVEDQNTRPKAIFLDVTFTQKRDDTSVDQLLSGLCRAKNEYGVDIYLAALASPKDGKLHVRNELEHGVETGCFKLVSVNYAPDPVDRLSWDYPMLSHVGPTGWAGGLSDNDAPVLSSAALSIAKGSAGLTAANDNESLALVWGIINDQPSENKPDLFGYCRYGDKSFYRLIPGVIRGLHNGEDSRPICPYNLTYSVAQLGTLSDPELTHALKDRYVLIGAVVPGQNDLIDSPVHGTIPGVYLHAMALDNLLTFGNSYKRSTSWDFPPSFELLTAGFLSIFIVLIVHVIWNSLITLLPKSIRSLIRLLPKSIKKSLIRLLSKWSRYNDEDSFENLEIHQRIIGLLPAVLNWLARIAIQTSVTMLCVVLLQKHFSIGMLPVVELVGMTILAEMFGYASKVEAFFRPPTNPNFK